MVANESSAEIWRMMIFRLPVCEKKRAREKHFPFI